MFSGWSSRQAPPIPFGCLWSGTMSLYSANSLWQIAHLPPCSATFGSTASASQRVIVARDSLWGGADPQCAERQGETYAPCEPAHDRSRTASDGLDRIHCDEVSSEYSSAALAGSDCASLLSAPNSPNSGIRPYLYPTFSETGYGPYAELLLESYEGRTDCRKPASFAVALYCGIGSSSLNALVKAFDRLHMVRGWNSSCTG